MARPTAVAEKVFEASVDCPKIKGQIRVNPVTNRSWVLQECDVWIEFIQCTVCEDGETTTIRWIGYKQTLEIAIDQGQQLGDGVVVQLPRCTTMIEWLDERVPRERARMVERFYLPHNVLEILLRHLKAMASNY